MFALYGIFFAILLPNISENPELAWGLSMKAVLPPGAMGLMIASFFAAAMSSAATYATTSSAMFVAPLLAQGPKPRPAAVSVSSVGEMVALASVLLSAVSTLFIGDIETYVMLCLSLLCFLGVPIYFGIVWRRANQMGMWLSLMMGISAFLVTYMMPTGDGHFFLNGDAAFSMGVFVSTSLSLIGMVIGTYVGRMENAEQLNRFYVIMNTPIGDEQRLVRAGIQLPALVDAGLTSEGPEQLNGQVLDELYRADAERKIFGPMSSIEIRRENLSWYLPGFIKVTISCALLVVGTWLLLRFLFVW